MAKETSDSSTSTAPAERSSRVLIVDDEPDIRFLLDDVFSDEGYEVATAKDGNAGLAQIEAFDPDLVILDKNLPGPSGLDVLRMARARGVTAEVILVTGYASLESSVTCMELNAFSYLVKPFELSALLLLAKRALDRRYTHQALERRTRELEETMGKLVASERQLAMNQRLAAMGRVATTVAHEVNNPATCLMGFADWIEDADEALGALLESWEAGQTLDEVREGPNATALAECQEIVRDAPGQIREVTARIVDIARDLTTFARAGVSRDKELFDLTAICKSTLRVVRYDFDTGLEIETDLDDSVYVRGLSGRCSQVLMNLMSNAAFALRETPPASGEPAKIRVSLEAADGDAVLVVADNGPGVPTESVNAVFEPFFTTKAIGKGTGMGLHVCRDIVEAMGGSIGVTNRAEGGAVFTVRLPLAKTRRQTQGLDLQGLNLS